MSLAKRKINRPTILSINIWDLEMWKWKDMPGQIRKGMLPAVGVPGDNSTKKLSKLVLNVRIITLVVGLV